MAIMNEFQVQNERKIINIDKYYLLFFHLHAQTTFILLSFSYQYFIVKYLQTHTYIQ